MEIFLLYKFYIFFIFHFTLKERKEGREGGSAPDQRYRAYTDSMNDADWVITNHRIQLQYFSRPKATLSIPTIISVMSIKLFKHLYTDSRGKQLKWSPSFIEILGEYFNVTLHSVYVYKERLIKEYIIKKKKT
jgi:hypothetical protein